MKEKDTETERNTLRGILPVTDLLPQPSGSSGSRAHVCADVLPSCLRDADPRSTTLQFSFLTNCATGLNLPQVSDAVALRWNLGV